MIRCSVSDSPTCGTKGVEIVATRFWSDQVDLVDEVKEHRDLLSGFEIQLLGTLWPDEACGQQIRRCATELGLPLSLSPVIPDERVRGKQHLRTRWSYRLEELEALDQRLSQQGTNVDRVLCRVDSETSPWETMTRQRDLPALSQIGAIDWTVEFGTVDERAQIVRAAEALFALACLPGSRLFLEPLRDLDRTMDVTHGLLDRLCNPRPVFNVVRCLNTILFSEVGSWKPVGGSPVDGVRKLGLEGESATLWLLAPVEPTKRSTVNLTRDLGVRSEKANETTSYDLVRGTSRSLLAEVKDLDLDGIVLLKV